MLVAFLVVGNPAEEGRPLPEGFAATAATGRPEVTRELGDEYDNYLRGIDEALTEIKRAMAENPGNERVRKAYYRARSTKASALDRLCSGGY